MIAAQRKSPAALAGTDGLEGELRGVARPSSSTIADDGQVAVTGGIYSRRLQWIYDGLTDLELSGVSCLLRAPRGGEALAILSRLPSPMTARALDSLVDRIRLAHAQRLFRNWEETAAEFSDRYCQQLRCYSMGTKQTFTATEASAHQALIALLMKEGGNPWAR